MSFARVSSTAGSGLANMSNKPDAARSDAVTDFAFRIGNQRISALPQSEPQPISARVPAGTYSIDGARGAHR